MPSLTFVRRCWLLALLLLTAVFVIRITALLVLPEARVSDVVDYIFDDGYYYMTVAANLAESGRSTFDGLTLTNGYQPLWLLVLALYARIVGTGTHTLFVATCILIYVLVFCGIALAAMWRKREWAYIPLCCSIGLAAAVLRWPLGFIEGLEPVLMIPLMLLFVVWLECLSDRRQLYRLSMLLALMFLVRLDSLTLYATTVGALALGLSYPRPVWSNHSFASALNLAARLSAVVVPTVLVYLAVNQWLFHSAVPVSGLAKSIGGPKFHNWGVAKTFIGPLHDTLFLVPVLLLLEWLARKVADPAPVFYRSLMVVLAAAALQCLYFCITYTWYVMPWYEYLLMVAVALVIARIVYLAGLVFAQSPPRPQQLTAAILVGIVGVWMGIWTARLADNSVSLRLRVAIRDTLHIGNAKVADVQSFNQISLTTLAEHFDPNRHVLVAMGDRAGGLAYWGRKAVSVMQLEGLMLDRGYIQALLAHRGREYLEQNFPIDQLLIDREVVLTVQTPDGLQYVIPDPVRGRITIEPVPTFCFPASAVRYQRKYLTYIGVETRMAFQFSDRVGCSASSLEIVNSIVTGIGLQRYSLPGEYDTRGGWADTALELRDRHALSESKPVVLR